MYHLVTFSDTKEYAVLSDQLLKKAVGYQLLYSSKSKSTVKSLASNLITGQPRVRLKLENTRYDNFCDLKRIEILAANSKQMSITQAGGCSNWASSADGESEEEPFQSSEDEYIPPSSSSSEECSWSSTETTALFYTPLKSSKTPSEYIKMNKNPDAVKRCLFRDVKDVTKTDKHIRQEVKDKTSEVETNGSNEASKATTVFKKEVKIETSEVKKKKKHMCIFCKKLIMNFSRHLEQMHKEEERVKNMLVYSRGNHVRAQIIEQIRKEGDFVHNSNNDYNSGNLILQRRPQKLKKRLAEHFICCPQCKGYYSKLYLRKHYYKCVKNAHDIRPNGKTLFATGRAFQKNNIHPVASKKLSEEVFPYLRQDNVTNVVRFDELAILYGNEQCEKYKSPHLHKMIRARLRLVGHFLLKIKSINGDIQSLEDVYTPQYYKCAIEAIHKLGRLKEDGRYEAPTTASDARTMIIRCGDILERHYLTTRRSKRREEVKDFLLLFKPAYRTSVSNSVQETKVENFRRKEIKLPSLSDIKKLNIYLKETRRNLMHELQQKFVYMKWELLASVTLTSLQIFNRRRPGEIQRLLIEDYKSYESVQEDDLFRAMSENAQKLAKMYGRCSLRGKLGRTVSIIISKELKDCIDYILHSRQKAGVPKINPYVFGIPSVDKRIRTLDACELLRTFSQKCNATDPKSLRATTLRKHIATHSVTMELKENDVQNLADFMGHQEKIHKNYYRLPVVARDVTIISQYLIKAQGEDIQVNFADNNRSTVSENNLLNYKNKSNSGAEVFTEINNDKVNNCTERNEITTKKNTTRDKIHENNKDTEETNIKEVIAKGKNFELKAANSNVPMIQEETEINDDVPCSETQVFTEENNSQLYNDKINNDNQYQCSLPVEVMVNYHVENTNQHNITEVLELEAEGITDNRIKRNTWSTPEKKIMRRAFARYLDSKTLPGIQECVRVKEEYKRILKNREPITMKAWINNQNKRKTENLIKLTWTTPEKQVMRRVFRSHLTNKIIPTLSECSQAISKFSILRKRTPEVAKAWVNNQIKNNKTVKSKKMKQ